jgi:hypothetical protein
MKRLTTEEYLQLKGLQLLINDAKASWTSLEKAVAKIVDVEEEGHGYYGHVSDSMWEEDIIAHLKPRLGLTLPADLDEKKVIA